MRCFYNILVSFFFFNYVFFSFLFVFIVVFKIVIYIVIDIVMGGFWEVSVRFLVLIGV